MGGGNGQIGIDENMPIDKYLTPQRAGTEFMAMLNMASDEMRLPMTELNEAQATILKKALKDYGLLS